MTNVVFFIGSLQAGGTEAKLARNFLPLLRKRGRINPKLLLLQERGEFLEVVPSDIERMSLDESENSNVISVMPGFRTALKALKADVVVSCMWYPAVISYLARKFGLVDFAHIVHDTTTMSEYIKYEFGGERFGRLMIYLTRKAYSDAGRIIVVSHGEKEDLLKNFGIDGNSVQVIYNPINLEEIRLKAETGVDIKFEKPVVVSVGRLIYSKGFDILLNAFRRVRDRLDCRLLILGEGKEREGLESLVRDLELDQDVIFLGFDENPFRYMKRSTAFCTATRYEGLGNAIIEAMALGLPVVATDCRSGPGETLDGGKYGILVPLEDSVAIADALIKVLGDEEFRVRLSESSLKRAEDFGPEASLGAWEDTILESMEEWERK